MSRRRAAPRSPLPQRDGVDAVRLRLPGEGSWDTVRDHLAERLAPGPAVIDAMLAHGEFVRADGGPVAADAPYEPGLTLFFHREHAPESHVPFEIDVIHQDEHLVVVDKPHFLATTPRGSHVRQTALSRLRHELGIAELSPAHRLDRLTAGLVLFTVQPEERGRYQTMFRDRRVHKEYEAVADHRPELALPRTVSSRIVKERGILQAAEVPGEPNALTEVRLLGHDRRAGHYLLLPRTGRTHQLRVHMNSLGLPLRNDPLYPQVLPPSADGRDPADEWAGPLQLLARALEFTDPVTGREHRFVSGRRLSEQPEY